MRNTLTLDKIAFYAHTDFMKPKLNTFALLKWISENGDQDAKLYLSEQTGMTVNSINRALANKTIPRAAYRYRIYAVTGIRLLESDSFPEAEIRNRDAS